MLIVWKGVDIVGISCDCSVDIDEVAEFCNESYPKARKEYICCECTGIISKGSNYEEVTGKWNGEISTYKTCIPCTRIRNHYCSSGFYFTRLREQIRECIGFDYTRIPEGDD